MDTGAVIGLVVAGVVVFALLVMWCIFGCCTIIVRQEKSVCMESMGKFKRVLEPGFHMITPIVEHPRQLVWKKTTYDS